MKFILIGYGKMGHAIEKAAVKRHHVISKIIRKGEIKSLQKNDGDVAIEFTDPDSAFDNIHKCLEINLPVISGTTGWQSRKSDIESICNKLDGTFFYAPNFSIGVNILFRINRELASLSKEDYTPVIEEIHHINKKDLPSGTAISLAEGILKNNPEFIKWSLKTEAGSVFIKSKRENEVPGTHIVEYISELDKITISHEAFGREGFANGAVRVAEWITGKKGVLSMNDFLKF